MVRASPAAYSFGLRPGAAAAAPRSCSSWPGRSAGTARSARRSSSCRAGRSARPAVAVQARVAPLGSALVLVLVEDRTEARRVDAVRRDFVANVSHELKTPVGAMALLAEALTDAADDPEAVRRFAGRMQHESDRLSRLVQDVIELSRLQGHDPLEAPALVSLDDVVAEAVDRSRLTAEARGDQPRLRVGPRAQGDGRRPAAGHGGWATWSTTPSATAPDGTPGGRLDQRGGRPGRAHRRDQRHRRGPGHRPGRAGPDLRALLPGRLGPLPGHRRDRPGARDRQARRRRPRWRGDGVERRGDRLHLHPAAPCRAPGSEGRT